MLTPADIHNKEFKRGFRGYSEEEVDDFLDEIVGDYEALTKEVARLEGALALERQKGAQYQELEKNLQDTLVVAQKTADEVVRSAKLRADEATRKAQLDCDRLRQQTEMTIQRRMEEAAAQLREQQALYDRGVQRERQFLIRIRSLLRTELELFEGDSLKEAIGALGIGEEAKEPAEARE